jgi:DNA repair protein RadC
MCLFNDSERELIEAARMILRDGVQRLKGRQGLFPTNRARTREARQECREARDALTAVLIADYGSLRHEVAIAVLIDAQGRLIEVEQFPQGKASRVELSPRILAGWIIQHGASAVLLAHNHPSGDNTPSQEDVILTERFGKWLAVMECELIEHLVLNGEDAAAIIGDW